jgi:hypothetical protein
MTLVWWLPIVAIAAVVLALFLWRTWRKAARATPLIQAKQRFHAQRERLEAKFVQLAAAHARTDAPQWADCTFDDDVSYVRNRTTGELSAFVAVTIASDNLDAAIRGSSDAVGNLQAGTAVFRFDRDHWETDGRAFLNLSPSEAVQHFRNDLEVVAEEFAHRV